MTHFIVYLYGDAKNVIQNEAPAVWYMFGCFEFLFFRISQHILHFVFVGLEWERGLLLLLSLLLVDVKAAGEAFS